jgi:hypothetical protein
MKIGITRVTSSPDIPLPSTRRMALRGWIRAAVEGGLKVPPATIIVPTGFATPFLPDYEARSSAEPLAIKHQVGIRRLPAPSITIRGKSGLF